MKCPACKEEMIILELNEVEIDHCCECGGIWLDSGELELLVGGGEAVRLDDAVSCNEELRKCPRCRKKMAKVYFGSRESRILLDACREHGLWFDKGELHSTAEMIDKDNAVLKLLNEMFASEM